MLALVSIDGMPTSEVLMAIVCATVVILNIYRLSVSITGFEEVEDWPLWHHISGLTETFNYIALAVFMLCMITEINEHAGMTMKPCVLS